MEILVLGGGKIGSVIARDLKSVHNVTVADLSEECLKGLSSKYNLTCLKLDFNDTLGFKKALKNFDLIVSAVPGYMGYQVLEIIIDSGKNVVDISFFSEDPFALNDLAIKKGVTAVVDSGVAPGLCNIILGHHMDDQALKSYSCYVGGLPFDKQKPFEYKAPFSPIDVIEEYTRPARMRVNGKEIIKEALSDIETIHFDEVGILEAFNTDGLRTILKTTKIANLKEKTLRYSGHADLMKAFRDTGLLSKDVITIDGQKIKPLDLTSKLLFEHWKLEDNEKEFTIMKVDILSKNVRHVYILYDETDVKNNMSSMSRTTGFTCTAVTSLIAENLYNQKGIVAPEFIGKDKPSFDYILSYLKKRGVKVKYYNLHN